MIEVIARFSVATGSGGAAAEIDIGTYLTLEPGINWDRIFYGAASIDVGSLFVRAGVRLGQ